MIKAVEESPGVVSMIRWVLRAMTYIYGFTVLVILSYWVYDAITGEPNWIFAGTFTGIVGALKGGTEVAKVFQKQQEVKTEIAEMEVLARMDKKEN